MGELHHVVDGAELGDAAVGGGFEEVELVGRECQGGMRGGGAEARLTLRTSTPPMPMTLAPGLTRAICFAAASVFSTLRPMMQAFAPRWTRARVWALQMEPAPPVMKRTRLAARMLATRFRGAWRDAHQRCHRPTRC